MMKNRRNFTDWAGVTIVTQPAAPLPETKDGRDTGKTTFAKASPSLKQGGSAGGSCYCLLYYAGD